MLSEAVVMSVPSGRIRVVALLALAGRVGAGVLLGAATAVVSLGFVVCGSLAYVLVAAVPGARRAVTHRLTAVAAVLAAWETRRLAAWYPGRPAVPYVIGRRAFGYLAVRWLVGVLGGMVSALLVFGAIGATRVLWEWAGGVPTGAESFGPAEPGIVAYFLVLCAILLFLDLSGFTGVVAADRLLAARLLAPGTQEALERRVSELTASRAEVVEAVTTERRRIERDLHDGVQQRVVSLAVLLGRAQRGSDADRSTELVRQAHEESLHVLTELQDVAWRVYPAALDRLGLHETLASIAERAGVPVDVDYRLEIRPPSGIEAVAYFVASEGVTNAVKHAGASAVTVRVIGDADHVVVSVHDDGGGGADPTGGGLSGLAGRVAAYDGRFAVVSPVGGPTTLTAVLPCA